MSHFTEKGREAKEVRVRRTSSKKVGEMLLALLPGVDSVRHDVY